MARFASVLPALQQGHSIQRSEWEPVNRLFVADNALMWQCGGAKPFRCALTWDELSATDWRHFEDASGLVVNESSAGFLPISRDSDRAMHSSFEEASQQHNSNIFLMNQK